MKRKILLILLTVLVVFSMFSVAAMAYDTPTSGSCGANGDNVTWSYDESTKTLTISGSGDMADFVNYIPSWGSYKKNIQSVIINDGITSIGVYAFDSCSSLTSVTIPNSVTSIGGKVFYGCSSLTSVTIPDGVTSIGSYAFEDCSGLTSVTIPNSVTRIGEYAFSGCSSLIDVEILGTVTDIPFGGVFKNCNNLQKVNVYELFALCKLKYAVSKDKLYLNGETLDNANILDFGYCGESVGCILYADKKLSIFGSGDMEEGYIGLNYIPISGAEYIEIAEGITNVSGYPFDSCDVESITIPSTVTKINKNAFKYKCPKNINYNGTIGKWFTLYPHNISSVIHCNDGKTYNICGDNATWSYDEATRTLIISGSGDIADCYYHGAPWENIRKLIHYIVIKDGITGIGNEAFEDCIGLKSISIPNSVNKIGERAFEGCDNLQSIVIPEGVTTIEERTFDDCGSLVEVTIPKSITTICDSAFENWGSLEKVNYAGADSEWNAINIDFNNENLLKVKPQAEPKEKFTSGSCGENVSAVFDSSTGTLTISGNGAMTDYYGYNKAPWDNVSDEIKTVIIKEGVTGIGAGAFAVCYNLRNITIPQSIKSIGEDSFNTCGMTSIVIPGEVTEIREGAFFSCQKLQNITIPKSVIAIGNSSFAYCNELSSVNYDGTDDEWNAIDIGSRNTYLLNLKPQRIDSFADISCGDNAKASFDASTGTLTISGSGNMKVYPDKSPVPWENVKPAIKSIVIEDGITNISYDAFEFCINLKNVTIPDSVTSIGVDVFRGCSSLTSVTIPDSVTSIEDCAFCDCSGLTSVTIPDSVTSIGDYAFHGCSSLTSVTIPNSVTSIEDWAFYGCSSLTSVTIPDSVTAIDSYTFYKCKNLTSVTIPKSVVTIGYRAFGDCNNLKTVNYDGTDDEWKSISIALGNDPLLKIKGNGSEIITKQPQTFNQSFAQAVTKTMGDSPFTKTATLTQGNGTITYDSSNKNVANVDNNGKVTIKGVGTATIKATAAGTEDWLESSIQYTLTVKQAQTQPPSGGGGGGGGGGSVTPPPTKGKPTVSTNGNGGTVSADDNGKVTITPNTGYKVKDVTVNGKSVGVKTELTGLTSDDKVVVTFEKIDGEDNPVLNPPAAKFADVQNHWAAEAINYVVEKGMMNGVDSKQFEPNQSTSRAMIVTILYRLENEPAVTANSNFKDVADGQYYSKAVAWANANGIVTGYSATEFAPNDNITREQMSSILSRYANYKGINTTSTGSLGNFADGIDVSNYAQSAMSWAIDKKLIQGDSGKLNPTAGATRAEVATILMRYCENILK